MSEEMVSNTKQIRTRMAPSPTGNLHLGTAYATLWPFLFARHNKGVFILRIEDTDTARSTKEFEENIVQGLQWLGFSWDEGVYRVMDRLPIYQKKAEELVEQRKAYYCFCTKEELEAERQLQIAEHQPIVYSGKCRNLTKEEALAKKESGMPYVIRFKMPEDRGVIEYEDLLHGKISIDSKLIGDTVILRQNGIPLYNFAVVVDDIDMRITHVIRGDDHISNTPKQIVLFEALGVPVPQYGHTPMILNQDRDGKLSKRTGSTSVDSYRNDGYLPEAIINYLALLGWRPQGENEIFPMNALISEFDIKDMNNAAAAWNSQKLDWINGEYIRKMSDEELTQRLQDFYKDVLTTDEQKELIEKVTPLVKERLKTLRDFELLTNFIFEKPEYDKDIFDKLKVANVVSILQKIKDTLESLPKPWTKESFETTFQNLAKELNLNNTQMFQLIRIAISGKTVTPPLYESIEIIGEDSTVNRVENAIQFLEQDDQSVTQS